MAESVGFVLAAGAITATNRYVFLNKPIDAQLWRIVTATGLGAILFSGAESLIGPKFTRPMAILLLLTTIIAPTKDTVSPATSALNWFEGKKR